MDLQPPQCYYQHMTLIEIIMAVKEQNLSKDKLEHYRDTLANLYAEMKEKEEVCNWCNGSGEVACGYPNDLVIKKCLNCQI